MFFFENSFPFFVYSVKIEWVYFMYMVHVSVIRKMVLFLRLEIIKVKEGNNNGIE